MATPRALRLTLILLAWMLQGSSSCLLSQEAKAIRAVGAIDRVMGDFDNTTKNSIELLKTLQQEFHRQERPELALRVQGVIKRAQTDSASRCAAGFLRERLKAELNQLKFSLINAPVDQPAPVVCEIVPPHIDRDRLRSEPLTIELHGYDLDLKNDHALKLIAVARDGGRQERTDLLKTQNHQKANLQFTPNTLTASIASLEIRSGVNVLGSVAVVHHRPKHRIIRTELESPNALHPKVQIPIPQGHVLIGGGCRSQWSDVGHLLQSSYPSQNAWVCEASAHVFTEEASLRAYALSVPHDSKLSPRITKQTSELAQHAKAEARIPKGHVLIGGGCRVHDVQKEGNFITRSYPGSEHWVCQLKDHLVSSKAKITAYAISLPRSGQYEIKRRETMSERAHHPRVSARLPFDSTILVGGGCNVQYGGAGSLLWATYPDLLSNAWACGAKDHKAPDLASVRAYSLGIRWKEP